MNEFERLKEKKRIVVKIGSSSLMHEETGDVDFETMEKLVRVLTDLTNRGKQVILVTSGAMAAGRKSLRMSKADCRDLSVKQAVAAVGQARLMMFYQKIFAEYNQIIAQLLLTKYTLLDNEASRQNAHNTFVELLKLGVIPIVNENDTVATDEIVFGDNDTLSAEVCRLTESDLLILLSDIDGLYTDNPRTNKTAGFIRLVEKVDEKIMDMGKGAGSDVGTGGMFTKIKAAKIATEAGADMVIANAADVSVILKLIEGEEYGTLFLANKK
jgi:glutamate 5-kinase